MRPTLRFRSLLAPTRAEPGCLLFELILGQGDDPAFYLVERWTDHDPLAAHDAQP